MKHPVEDHFLNVTRRQFFGKMAQGIGTMALGSMLGNNLFAGVPGPFERGFLGSPHFAPKAKRVIYLFQHGGPSQMDLFDYKPGLADQFDKELPKSVRGDQRITGMTSGQSRLPVAPSIFQFKKYENNQDGLWVSELYPHTASVAKDLCVVHSVFTEQINHEPGVSFFQTGHQLPGRPSFGAWMSYGLGSMNENLPSFVVMISQGRGTSQFVSSRLWGSGFLPSEHQGINLRSGSDPVLFLKDPDGIDRTDRRRMLDQLLRQNNEEAHQSMDPEVIARIAQYEMAYRMQTAVPELTDFSNESQETLDMYGPNVKTPGSYAYNCLMARRLAERDVRFVQLYHRGWDQHFNLPKELRMQCEDTDQPQAALVKDLKRLGMLDDTLVIWGGEFGRTTYSQGVLTKENHGRDHHPRCFTMWFAGGGTKPGITYGKTDDYCYNIIDKPMHVHDLHATLLHLMGIDHERLTYRYQG
ncbi:MAG: DUF1501 domain-containing protein, partial [Spartobacteria bacterium]|nr:DUF1501 domain-containing protein [Spartobacteria bacterium]